jgi:2-dehydropantoate 2-reductase
MIDSSVVIVGAGAIGGVIAAKLTSKVRNVAVLDPNTEHVDRMRDPGLVLDDLGEEYVVPIYAHADPDDLNTKFDFVLLTVKATHLDAATEALRERDLANTFVSLGNGLVQERVARAVGAEKVIAGIVEWGATNLGPGRLAQTTQAPFVIGELDGEVRERTTHLARTLEPAAEVRVTQNVWGHIWSKLLLNSTFSGLGVVSGLLYKEVAANAEGKEAAYALWREGFDTGRAEGVEFEEVLGVPASTMVIRGPNDREEADRALATMMGYGGEVKASMLQDLERGLKTEVDVINGAVVEHGEARGVETPLNKRIVELVHAMEQGERQPSAEVFDELCSIARQKQS